MQKKLFRYDINGLRAIAVIAVVLFHFNSSWVPGGFAGVDVFFVISGFLMTGIIVRGFENDNFNLFKFYVARANRIIPALAALCFILLVFGWFYFTPLYYKTLSKHAASSVVFLSNIIYWRESGYFDAESHEKWLLHTWSLSVEWQFYVIYPIVLMVLRNLFSFNSLKRLLIVGTILGLGFSIFASIKWPIPAYYLLPTRAWEMMFGGVAYLYPLILKNNLKKILGSVGLVLIVLSYAFFSSQTPWPSYFAVLPVLGALLIIIANRETSFFAKNFIFQAIGRWSYSIYLWHWPVVVFGYYFNINNWWLYGIPISLLFGFISYRFIEKLQWKSWLNWFDLFKVKPIWITTFVFLVAITVITFKGFNFHFRHASNTLEAQYIDKYQLQNYMTNYFRNEYMDQCNYFDGKSYTTKKEGIDSACTDGTYSQGILLWGDSHAQALSHGLRKYFPNIQFNQVASSGCRPLTIEDTKTKGEFKISCDLSNKKALDTAIKINPKVIIFAQGRDHDQNDFYRIAKTLRSNHVTSKLFLIGPVPQWNPSLPRAIANRHFNPNDNKFSDPYFNRELLKIDAFLSNKYINGEIEFISVLNRLCDRDKCLAKVDNNNTPIVWDYGHLSLEGSEYVVKEVIAPRIDTFLK